MKTFGKAKMGQSESTSFDPIIHLIQLHLEEIHTHAQKCMKKTFTLAV